MTGIVRPDALDDLIHKIYDAALEDVLWPEVLEKACDILGRRVSANLFVFEGVAGPSGVCFMQSARIDPDCVGPYIEHYHKGDLWAQGVMKACSGKVLTNSDLFSQRTFEATEWYSDFLAKIDIYHWMSSRFAFGPDTNASLSFYLPSPGSGFGSDALNHYKVLAPHIYRALRIRQEREVLRLELAKLTGINQDANALVSSVISAVSDNLTMLQDMYSLTTAEARVAAQIAAGKSPKDIAIETGVAVSTVRNQLRVIYEKTETGGLVKLSLLLGKLVR